LQWHFFEIVGEKPSIYTLFVTITLDNAGTNILLTKLTIGRLKLPPRITGFRGSVHLSGGQEVPNGDLYFGIEPNGSTEPILSFGERKPQVKQNSTGE
jgi:hypothetical protein